MYLQHSDIGVSIRTIVTAVLSDVFQPLDMRLSIAVNLADKAGVLPNVYRGVGWQTSLENRSMRGPFC